MAQPVELPDNVRRAVTTLYSIISSLDARLVSGLKLEEAVRSKESLRDIIRAVDALVVWLHDGEGPLARGEDLKL
jgi:ethanolamine utilization microcompartment shell protein EutL